MLERDRSGLHQLGHAITLQLFFLSRDSRFTVLQPKAITL